MDTKVEIHNISLPIQNGMWSYRPEWANNISVKEAVADGGASTVYQFNLFSHTGTYIETAEHKLNCNLKFDSFDDSHFCGKVKLFFLFLSIDNAIRLSSLKEELKNNNLSIETNDKVIIATGYGKNNEAKNYLENAPHFEQALTDFLIGKKISLLGVDTPIMENRKQPYSPVVKLFTALPKMLLLAPLNIDTDTIKTGIYIFNGFPLVRKGVSGSLCNASLIKLQ